MSLRRPCCSTERPSLLGSGDARPPDLQLEGEALRLSWSRGDGPPDDDVHPPPRDRVLALDVTAAVHDPVEEGEEDERRCNFVVGRRAEERLAVLEPEGLEGIEDTVLVEAAVG